MVAIWPLVPPTCLEENEVGREYESEKEVGEMTLKLNTQVDLPLENLTLVEENEPTQRDKTQKVVNVEYKNIVQPKATVLGNMIVGEKLDITRPQLQVVKFIEPQPEAKIGRPSGLGGHEASAKVMARSHMGCTSHPSTSTHRQLNGKDRVKYKKGSKLGVKHGWPPLWSP
ncbi:hypothetical protein L3X38_024637 [Prunus dulcis]|uniref:Uncharacterized protein n=1 Tax=Prunus dulcis TaxID=3755 RepID=A0AAD4W1T0_PRUDU|nr:hypothetical protein L3X38_024637 [Prunus dulcis]